MNLVPNSRVRDGRGRFGGASSCALVGLDVVEKTTWDSRGQEQERLCVRYIVASSKKLLKGRVLEISTSFPRVEEAKDATFMKEHIVQPGRWTATNGRRACFDGMGAILTRPGWQSSTKM